ncbi:rCG20823 [Rattus norvegicus]|uniref:RCG20823 n=1 Tax=Rattus norvegicus TaxID=10116 RepID=A6JE66_RAT|nr:rCG20823 [Rattus norvegicus]
MKLKLPWHLRAAKTPSTVRLKPLQVLRKRNLPGRIRRQTWKLKVR